MPGLRPNEALTPCLWWRPEVGPSLLVDQISTKALALTTVP